MVHRPNTFLIHNNNRYRKIRRQDNGQLIALMGITLAISVFMLASLATQFPSSNVISFQQSTSSLTEFIHIRDAFGLSLQYNLATIEFNEGKKCLIFHTNIVDESHYTIALSKTAHQFSELLLVHGVQFNAYSGAYSHIQFQNITENGHVYHVTVILEYNDGTTYIKQNVVYSIISKEPNV